ncbi:MAG: hypothetical protein R3C40_08450 [Parvularculaceae bacterium]
MSDKMKLVIAIALDIIDFTAGRILGAGTLMDIAFAVIAFFLWGPVGLFALWEALDPSEQIDGFVPTMTLIALSQIGKKKKQLPREPR